MSLLPNIQTRFSKVSFGGLGYAAVTVDGSLAGPPADLAADQASVGR